MIITITIEQEVKNDRFIVDHRLTDTEIDYAAFDIVCHTVNKLREELKREIQCQTSRSEP